MKHTLYIILLITISSFCFGQKNLDFEKWDINNLGIDEALEWINIADASEYGAPQVLFKEVESPAQGLASIKLTTKYWKQGRDYELDTLVGALIQQIDYAYKPESFEFSYQSFPKKGDEILVGIQLTVTENNEKIVVGEGYFTSSEKQKEWKKINVTINYFSNLLPTELTLIALSSASATIIDGKHGDIKVGSTLLLDDIKLNVPVPVIDSPNLTLLNTVK